MRRSALLLLLLLPVLLLTACARGAQDTERYAFGVVTGGAFGVMNGDSRGNAYSEATHGYYDAGTELTAHAVPSEGSSFYCWTAGASLEDGGYILSYDKDFTFSLAGDLWLYPNFRDRDEVRVLYHANGGSALDPEAGSYADTLWDGFSLDYYLYPNALPDAGYFTRDGYTLAGYSTEPDGSGELYRPGWKVFEDTDAVIELWCVWSEQSPADDFSFRYDADLGGWCVNGYYGPGGEVSVPAAYSGSPVAGVDAGAFAGNASVTGLVFPSSLRYIADGACSDMENLASVQLFDSLSYVSDASFAGDTALDSVCLSAATNPHYSDWFNNHAKKIEIMNWWKDDERPMLVILGGSSTAYAVDAQQLQGLLDREYVVLNCGTNGANLFNMASDWAMHFMEEGDFLLHIIEYSAWQMGGIQCAWETFRSFEGCYNVFSWVPVSQYEKFFDCFGEFLTARAALPEESYEDYVSYMAGTTGYFDLQGTLTVETWGNGSDDFWQGRSIVFCGNYLYEFMADRMNAQYAKLADMGVGCALAYTPLNRNALYADQTEEDFDAFEAYLADNLNITILGGIRDAIWEPAVFYDDDYHLASPARAEYTERLAGDLNAYFASEDAAQ